MTQRQQMRSLQADLRQAQDDQIARVVAMVDALPERGAADDLIAPLRPRLAQLRPSRPFGFKRLLFTPLDPVIVPASGWRSGEPAIPRTILTPLGRALAEALPDRPDESEFQRLDRGAILAAGAKVWPAAAAVLADLPLPRGWTDGCGLPAAEYMKLRPVLIAIFAEAAEVERVAQRRVSPPDEWIRHMLRGAGAHGPVAELAMLAVLLARLPDPARVLALTAESSRSVADQALQQTLSRLETEVSRGGTKLDITQAAIEAGHMAAVLDGLEDRPGLDSARKRQVDRLRRDADQLCRQRFEAALTDTLAQTATTLTAVHDDATITAIEAAARELRRLESAGRRLGSGEHFDKLLRQAAAGLVNDESSLGLADRMRLVEILAGPEMALAMLQGDGPN